MAEFAPLMIHRFLALLGYAAARINAWLRPPLARLGMQVDGVWLVVLILLVVAAVPTYLEASKVSPQGVSIDQITQRSLSALTSWVRLEGRVATLHDNRSSQAQYGVTSVLIRDGKAIMLSSSRPVDDRDDITGQAVNAPGSGDRIRSLAPPGLLDGIDVSPNGLVLVDDVPPPPSTTPWWLVYADLAVAAGLVVGSVIGYPVFGVARFRPATPLGAADQLPVGVAAELRRSGRTTNLRLGGASIRRADAPATLLLTIPDSVDAPAHHVNIHRDMWTSVRSGAEHTIGRSVPALEVRSFALHGIVSFGSASDRDRAAAVLNENVESY